MAKRAIYSPRCKVCKFMKTHPDFRLRIMRSTKFNENGSENLAGVVHAYGDPFPLQTLYMHIKRHQAQDVEDAKFGKLTVTVPSMRDLIEGDVRTGSEHELALDEIIEQGRMKLASKTMVLTVNHVIAAAKAKAEIEKSTKDRRLEAAKAFFSNKNEPETTRQDQITN